MERRGGVLEEGLRFEDGVLRGSPLGEIDETPGRVYGWWLSRHREGRVCPVCLDWIGDEAETCIHCVHEWRRIKGDARALAEWVAMAAEEPDLLGKGVVVWRREVG